MLLMRLINVKREGNFSGWQSMASFLFLGSGRAHAQDCYVVLDFEATCDKPVQAIPCSSHSGQPVGTHGCMKFGGQSPCHLFRGFPALSLSLAPFTKLDR